MDNEIQEFNILNCAAKGLHFSAFIMSLIMLFTHKQRATYIYEHTCIFHQLPDKKKRMKLLQKI